MCINIPQLNDQRTKPNNIIQSFSVYSQLETIYQITVFQKTYIPKLNNFRHYNNLTNHKFWPYLLAWFLLKQCNEIFHTKRGFICTSISSDWRHPHLAQIICSAISQCCHQVLSVGLHGFAEFCCRKRGPCKFEQFVKTLQQDCPATIVQGLCSTSGTTMEEVRPEHRPQPLARHMKPSDESLQGVREAILNSIDQLTDAKFLIPLKTYT